MKHAIPPPGMLLASLVLFTGCALSQEPGINTITEQELREHLTYLASDELEGRATGEPGLNLAAEYLAGEARRMGLEAIDEDGDYYHRYTLVSRSQDFDHSKIVIRKKDGLETISNRRFYFLNSCPDTIDLSGNVVFAGYGIHSEKDGYNDFADIDLQDKIVIIMNGGPKDGDGNDLFQDGYWSNARSYRYKLPELAEHNPKAVLIVPDPGSGYRSMEESSRGLIRSLSRSRYVEELGNDQLSLASEYATNFLFVHRDIVDDLLSGSGRTLEGLMNRITRSGKPASFQIEDTRIAIHAEFNREVKSVPNVVGLVEGSDPELKNELVVFIAHFDHLGMNAQGDVYNGADDNASGTTALLELGEAFKAEQRNLKRSVLFLWVSGEEIGLYGSEFYAEHPLLPLENTLAAINLDMIGVVRTAKDTGWINREKVEVMGMDSILLIGGHQSSDLMAIHNKVSGEMGIYTDLSKSSPDHPYRYYYRSDHFNFARKDVPVLFYSTGNHVDYHRITDDIERINFEKLKKVTELSFRVGFELVTMEERIAVDNPYSEWESGNLR
jgi:hypothetical protein